MVDDASERPCAEAIADEFPWVRVITNASNMGFARSNNFAIEASTGRFVLLLNSDAEVFPASIDTLVGYLDDHDDVGAVGPKVINAEGGLQPQCRRGRLTPFTGFAYMTGLDRLFSGNRRLGEYLMRHEDPDCVHDVKALSGACMMVRREVIEQLGSFDEAFVLYGEDLDWCYRMGAAGWRIVYLPCARVTHHGGKGGTSIRFLRSLYYYHRSLWILLRRYPANGLFPLYGWFIALMLTVRFLLLSSRGVWGGRRVGSRKGR